MMRREEFLKNHPNVKGDMVAYTRDGEKLGKIISLNDDNINIEKGFFFPRDFTISYDSVVDIHGNEIVIDRQRTDLSAWRSENYEGWNKLNALSEGAEVEIPLREEELQAHKSSHKAGEVRMKKIVHTETQSFSIPVTSEDVVIEHTPGTGSGETIPDEMAFKEEQATIPLMEEDVEVSKIQKVRETIHARKVTHTEQREVSGEIRKEDIEVETEKELGHETKKEK